MDPNPEETNPQEHRCPHCGTLLQPLSSIEGDQERWLCPRCDLATARLATELPGNGKIVQQSPPHDPRKRFRWLLEMSEAFPPNNPLPEWLIEDLPEEIQELLRSDLREPHPNLGPKLSDALSSALRDQGYVIEEDTHGVRLSGDLNRRGGHAGEISPYDVIRMASDLDGGLPSADELIHCPKCEAVLPPDLTRCSWCGTELDHQPPEGDQSTP